MSVEFNLRIHSFNRLTEGSLSDDDSKLSGQLDAESPRCSTAMDCAADETTGLRETFVRQLERQNGYLSHRISELERRLAYVSRSVPG